MGLEELYDKMAKAAGEGVASALSGDDDKPPKFSTTSAYQYNLVKEYLQDTYGVSATMAGSFANDFAAQWYDERGSLPQAYQLMADGGFNNRAARLVTGADFLPPYFQMDGSFFVNTPDIGPVPIPGFAADPEMAFLEKAQGVFSEMGYTPEYLQDVGQFYPRFSSDEVLSILNLRAPAAPRGGGGGGGGMREPKFDEATIAESMSDMWRYYLIDEMDEGKLGKWVSDFVNEAGSFAREGGSLGLDAWFKNRMRKESRYSFLYDKKPPEVDEDQWVGRYNQISLGTGMRDASVLRETERGASQGIGLGGFKEQLQRSPEVRTAQGGFSKQLASTVGGLGVMGKV